MAEGLETMVIFEDEILPGTEGTDPPSEEMPGRQDHGKNLVGTVRMERFAKSFILRAFDVLANDRRKLTWPPG